MAQTPTETAAERLSRALSRDGQLVFRDGTRIRPHRAGGLEVVTRRGASRRAATLELALEARLGGQRFMAKPPEAEDGVDRP